MSRTVRRGVNMRQAWRRMMENHPEVKPDDGVMLWKCFTCHGSWLGAAVERGVVPERDCSYSAKWMRKEKRNDRRSRRYVAKALLRRFMEPHPNPGMTRLA